MRMVSRTVRRGSGARPDRAATVRRVRRRGGASRMRVMMRRSAVSSSGVQAAKALLRNTSASAATRPRACCSFWPSWPGSVAGTTNVDIVSALLWAACCSGSGSASAWSRKNLRKIRSYVGIWSRRVTIVVRPPQYRSSRSVGSSRAIAWLNVSTSPEPTARPAPRNSSANATSTLTNGASLVSPSATLAHSPRGDPVEVGAHQFQVVVVLDHRAQGVLHRRGVQLGRPEHIEGAYPVDGLGYARRLGQLERAQPVDRRDHLAGQRLGRLRSPDHDDLDLALGARVADPVVDAAPLQRVVQLAGAVGGEHHQRWRVGPDGPDLRNGDLEVGQDLQQGRLELVVGPVNLVDEQHRPVAGPHGRQQRPLQQELRPEQRVDGGVVAQLPLRECAYLQHLPRV